LIWRPGGKFEFHEGDERASEIRPVASRSVNDGGDGGDNAAVLPDDFDGLGDASTARDHIFDNDEFFVGVDLKSAPEDESPLLFLGEDVTFPEAAGDFMANNQSAQGWGNDGLGIDATQLLSKGGTYFGGNGGVLKEQCALKELAAVETGAENEMPIDQGAGIAEQLEEIFGHRVCSGSEKVVSGKDGIARFGSDGDRFDLDASSFWQCCHLDGGASGKRIVKVKGVHLVHLREIVEVHEEHRGFNNIGERHCIGAQDGAEVFEHLFGLHGNIAFHEVTGDWAQGNLA
jgi:hypothetical protein